MTTTLPLTCRASDSVTNLWTKLGLPPVLTERVRLVSAPDKLVHEDLMSLSSSSSFVLYLPTVVLRSRHNPAFCLACHVANHLNVPLLVLSTVLDDAHHNIAPKVAVDNALNINTNDNDDDNNHGRKRQAETRNNNSIPIVGTARRLCFQLQVLQKASQEWQANGAEVAIRVHCGPSSRRPHHLTLARQAAITVTDEPFVHPYRSYVQSIAKAARICLCVDGSTTVPPLLKLRAEPDGTFAGVPPKAWMWKKKISIDLERHVKAIVEHGALDAPPLNVRVQPASSLAWHDDKHVLHRFFPKEWKDSTLNAPSQRAWTVEELCAIDPVSWAMESCPGIDTTVPPCRQTHGANGWQRWKNFQQNHLSSYQYKRNNIQVPHAVSRLSCYLNVGAISIFQIVHELWQDQRNTDKFQDEIVKWREISHAHAFSTPNYFHETALPPWSREYLQRSDATNYPEVFSLLALCNSQTTDPTWNAMQTYLRETGELHNNARMTWG